LQELEKFKFVLDYKIKELKQQIEPRENEIAAMKKQIKEVDAELEAYHKSNAELDELIGKLRGQLDTLQQQAGRLRSNLIGKESAVKDFSSELHDVMHSASTADRTYTDSTNHCSL
jgi:chromosome segregation ATPase